jgi:hypothetical protein
MIKIEIPSEEEFKQYIDKQMDDVGQITLGEDVTMQVLPEDDFNFVASPEMLQNVQLVVNIAGNIALNMVASWLYEKIKVYHLKTVKITDKQYNTDQISLQDVKKILEEQKNREER